MTSNDVRVTSLVDSEPFKFSWRKLWSFLGPGLLMSIAYVDPGNLESDLQMGAETGYVLLWLLLLSTVMGYFIQMQSAKLGVATGKHLAEHCRELYPNVPRKMLWIMVEVAIVGSDIQEVIGSAIAIAILSGGAVPLWAGVLMSAVCAFMLLLIERAGIRLLEAVFAVMIAVMIVMFGMVYVAAGVPTLKVVEGLFVPRLPKNAISVGVALVGSLIMPHNIYLHSALVQTRRLATPTPGQKREAMLYIHIESALALVGAIFINMFVIAVFARSFHGQPAMPAEIGLEAAGEHFGAQYGSIVIIIWGLGLLAAGQASTMTGTYTGQFVMSGFLDLKVSPMLRVLITRLFALVPTLAVALLYGGSNKLDELNQGLNILQAIQLPFALIPVLTLTSDKSVMGSFVTKGWQLAGCGLIAITVIAINITAAFHLVGRILDSASNGVLGIVVVLCILYFAFVAYLLLGPKRSSLWFSTFTASAHQQYKQVFQRQSLSDGHAQQPRLPPPTAPSDLIVTHPLTILGADDIRGAKAVDNNNEEDINSSSGLSKIKAELE